ncbi:MAG: ATP-binding cassette domain-containing protein [Phyllobacteriaceae bacterium]|jgi:peptide/nickel transport system ATP-binding protein|nr:ATP-binding cassette domain-containing protein [Phyllobacteriaceae bacterium]
MSEPLVSVRNLKMHFPIRSGLLRRVSGHVRAVDNVSFDIMAGETLGLVGESGCGKSTITRALLRVHTPTAGEMVYHGAEAPEDLAALDETALGRYRREIRLVFQDPQGSLNPRLPVVDIIGEVLAVNGVASGAALRERVAELMTRVGLRPETMHRYPHAFSGGERQRIGIARALAPGPKLLIADEAVSALDVSVQAQTINLLKDLQSEFGLTYLFVSHDLSVVQHICDRIAVMYVGHLVEVAPVDRLFEAPQHPYTEALLSAAPIADPDMRGQSHRIRLPGEVADPANPPAGCPFHPRCRFATEICARERPELRATAANDHQVACHHADDLDLANAFDGPVPSTHQTEPKEDAIHGPSHRRP